MPYTIGYSSGLGVGNNIQFSTPARMDLDNTGTYTAGDVVKSVTFTPGEDIDADHSFNLAIYSLASYVDDPDGATPVWSSAIPLVLGDLSNVEKTITIADEPLVGAAAGDTLFCVVTGRTSGSPNFVLKTADIAVNTSINNTTDGAIQDPWVESSTGVAGWAVSIELDSLATGPRITPSDDTPEDGVEQTVTCSDMTGPITAATLGGVSILSELSGTDPSSPITFTYDVSAQAVETNQPQPRIGVAIDLVFTTATDGAISTIVTIQPKTGWALVELEDPINTDSDGYIDVVQTDTGLTVTNADAVYYDTSNNADITVNGVYTSDLTTQGEFTKSVLQVGGTSPSTSYSDNFYPYGQIPTVPSLTLPLPLGSPEGLAAAESNVPVSVCTADDMVQVYSGVVSWGADAIVPAISDEVFVAGTEYGITINGNFIASYNVTAV